MSKTNNIPIRNFQIFPFSQAFKNGEQMLLMFLGQREENNKPCYERSLNPLWRFTVKLWHNSKRGWFYLGNINMILSTDDSCVQIKNSELLAGGGIWKYTYPGREIETYFVVGWLVGLPVYFLFYFDCFIFYN